MKKSQELFFAKLENLPNKIFQNSDNSHLKQLQSNKFKRLTIPHSEINEQQIANHQQKFRLRTRYEFNETN